MLADGDRRCEFSMRRRPWSLTAFVLVLMVIVVDAILYAVCAVAVFLIGRVAIAHIHSRHVVLQRVRQVVRIGKVKVGGQIDGLEHFDVFGFLAIVFAHALVGNVDHGYVLHLVDGVVTHQRNLAPFCDEDHVVP